MIPPKRLATVLLALSLAAWCGFPISPPLKAQESKPKRPVELLVNEADIVTRAAVCRWAIEPPVLDGKLDDRCWKTRAVIDRFAQLLDRTPRSQTGHLRLPWSGTTTPFTTPAR